MNKNIIMVTYILAHNKHFQEILQSTTLTSLCKWSPPVTPLSTILFIFLIAPTRMHQGVFFAHFVSPTIKLCDNRSCFSRYRQCLAPRFSINTFKMKNKVHKLIICSKYWMLLWLSTSCSHSLTRKGPLNNEQIWDIKLFYMVYNRIWQTHWQDPASCLF